MRLKAVEGNRVQTKNGRSEPAGSEPPALGRVSGYEDRDKTRSCAHTVGGRGLGTSLCPVPAVAAAMMARPTTTWTQPVRPGS